MSIGNAIKVGLVVAVAYNVAVSSYRWGKMVSGHDERCKALEPYGFSPIEVAFMSDERIKELLEQYA